MFETGKNSLRLDGITITTSIFRFDYVRLKYAKAFVLCSETCHLFLVLETVPRIPKSVKICL